jgi:hypothetical protein
MSVDRERLANRRHDPVREARDGGGVMHLVQQDREFVAAEAGNHFALPDAALQALRYEAQQPVAGEMTARVVDTLEMVEIQAHDCELLAAAIRMTDGLFEGFHEHRPICQPGQQIMMGHIDDLGVESLSFADVARDRDNAGDTVDRDVADRYFGPELAAVPGFAFPLENLGFALHRFSEIFDRDILAVGMNAA